MIIVLDAGKYALKQEPVNGPTVVSMLAVEKFSPGRNVLCRFFMNSSSYERECNILSRLPSGEQVPGVCLLKLQALAFTFYRATLYPTHGQILAHREKLVKRPPVLNSVSAGEPIGASLDYSHWKALHVAAHCAISRSRIMAGIWRHVDARAVLRCVRPIAELLDSFERGAVPGAPHLPPCLVTDAGDYSLAEWPMKRAR